MTWILLLSSPLIALGGWLWSRRPRLLRGAALISGRVAANDRDEIWQAGEPRPVFLEVEVGSGRTERVQLGDAPIEARWPRRPRVRAGDRIVIEALAVDVPREEAGYRENAQSTRLEAARVWVGSPPGRSRWPMALALAPLLALLPVRANKRPLELACPWGSSPQIVARMGGGWYGTCAKRHTAHGPWVEMDRQGIRLIEGQHCEGDRCGRWIWRTASGALREEGHFFRGKRTGRWTRFHASGRKQREGRYRDGAQVGVWRYWDSSGEKRQEVFDEGWPAEARVCEVPR